MATYGATYNAFSGVDMICTFGGVIIGELQGVSYQVTREVAPLYTMGSADPRAFSRGKRGIAGSLVFLVFDRDALLETMQSRSRYVANRYEVLAEQNPIPINEGRNVDTITTVNGALGVSNQPVGSFGRASNMVTDEKVIAAPRYADQILPFDIVISAGNEFGHMANMVIGGVQIMNSGSGMSIDDIMTDQAMTFVATHIKPWSNQIHIDIRNNSTTAPYGTVGSYRSDRPGSGGGVGS